MNIAVLCPSEIAFRRFMPALKKTNLFSFAGIGIASPEEWFGDKISIVSSNEIKKQQQTEKDKAYSFIEQYGGKIFQSYDELLSTDEIDSIYIPLPPGLHFPWAKKAIEKGKHVFVEKPATTSLTLSENLVKLSERMNVALHENYMFVFHEQIDSIDHLIKSGEIGEIRLIRISFGFPHRGTNDFRYNKLLGGGALLDCGGYTIRYACHLLGQSAKIQTANLNNVGEFDVDTFGSATMVNDDGITAQLAFGMDNDYKCELEIWGSIGCLYTGRILTAPDGFTPSVTIRKGKSVETRDLPSDDAFSKSICHFMTCIKDYKVRKRQYSDILRQAKLVEDFQSISRK